MFQDITDRKKAEQELKNSITELKRVNEAMVGRELKMIELKEKFNNGESSVVRKDV
ncbi:MAG: hypothetical protein ABIE03_04235 [Patescibacteria group bacterium]|nr:hypothetical protein [Patescibacteria group bacterium]